MLSIDSIIVQDARFIDFTNGHAASRINDQLNMLNSYPDVLVGWLGIDEPLSIDSYPQNPFHKTKDFRKVINLN